ncbi:MAG: 2-amino-4-hydroxy-6-hydroxymethyldihydropteridine diphosphokinase [Candidatus Eisenbacteria bacterium]|nr:2-amino-4-hydroxy-6-hydroxymethyldihydropteridine diphosphokinase [Candidatus Eisenbacteria bacterium]
MWRSRGPSGSPIRWASRSNGAAKILSDPAFISLGSNVEPERNLPRAVRALAAIGTVTAVSRVYQSAAVGSPGQPDFLNAGVLMPVAMPPLELRRRLRALERRLGRRRPAAPYAPRTCDLDLCLLGHRIVETETWRLPDPDILSRTYLAVTLAELAPCFRHPVTGEELQEIARRLKPNARLIPRDDVDLGRELAAE